MSVSIAHAGPIDHRHVIEERTIAVRSRPQLLQELREQGEVIGVDRGQLRELRRIIVVVRERVVGLGDTEIRERLPLDSRPIMKVMTRVRST